MTKTPVHASEPHPVDLHVGSRIVQRRKALELTQWNLAQALGVSYQQFQKYEKGINRVSASTLWTVAGALSVDIDFFFEGLEGPGDIVAAEVVPNALETATSRAVGVEVRALPSRQQKLVAALLEAFIQQNEAAASSGPPVHLNEQGQERVSLPGGPGSTIGTRHLTSALGRLRTGPAR